MMRSMEPCGIAAASHFRRCGQCGTIAKSGGNSCCGRGGSWFRNCGNAGSAKLDHTWYEGIQACKSRRAQYKRASGQQSNAPQQLHCVNCSEMGANSTSPIAPAKIHMSAVTSEHNTVTANSPSITSASTALITTESAHASMINTLNDMLITSPAHTRALTTTTVPITTNTITNVITTTTTTTAATATSEVSITTDWILSIRFHNRDVSESVWSLYYTSKLHTLFFIYQYTTLFE